MITPFNDDLTLDEEKYREFIRFQIENGCQLLTMGTTGESATMSHPEHELAVRAGDIVGDFASGAIKAIKFISQAKGPKIYTTREVLGLE